MKVTVDVPDGKSGDWSVESFSVEKDNLSEMISLFKTGRGVPEGDYKRLMRNGTVVMSNTPDEIRDSLEFYYQANGRVLINGLGLGVLVKMLIEKESVTEIIVIENSEDVIKLSGPTYEANEKVTIIHADAFEYQPPKGVRYDCVWHDIWDDITSDNLPDMIKLTRKYGRRADYQKSWCRWECERMRKENEEQYWY